MKYFGTVKSFDELPGHGSIVPKSAAKICGSNAARLLGIELLRHGLGSACHTTCTTQTAGRAP